MEIILWKCESDDADAADADDAELMVAVTMELNCPFSVFDDLLLFETSTKALIMTPWLALPLLPQLRPPTPPPHCDRRFIIELLDCLMNYWRIKKKTPD